MPVTPDSRLPIRAGFCSHYDGAGRVVFDGEYFAYFWDLAERGDAGARAWFEETLALKRAAGITHVVCDPPDGTVYGSNWIPSLPNWMAPANFEAHFIPMVEATIAAGLVPVLYYYGGGQGDAPAIYDGRLERLASIVRDHGLADLCIHLWAWESFGRSRECTAKQNVDAWELLRRVLGPSAYLAGHVDSSDPCRFSWASYLGDGYEKDTPAGAVWRDYHDPARPGLGEFVEADDPSLAFDVREPDAMMYCPLDVFFSQTPLPHSGPDQPDQAAKDRQVEGWDRYAPPGTWIPALNREVAGPDWFGSSHGRKQYGAALDRVVLCLWEPSIPYGFIRGMFGTEHVVDVMEWADSIGLENQGCLPAVPAAPVGVPGVYGGRFASGRGLVAATVWRELRRRRKAAGG